MFITLQMTDTGQSLTVAGFLVGAGGGLGLGASVFNALGRTNEQGHLGEGPRVATRPKTGRRAPDTARARKPRIATTCPMFTQVYEIMPSMPSTIMLIHRRSTTFSNQFGGNRSSNHPRS
jgi:hypothetical protein